MSESVELDVRRERAAKNQSLFREVNERIGELSGSATLVTFICECTDETCDQQVPMTHEQYERIRSDSNSFFVVSGHEINEIEQIVDVAEGYVVVAKLGRGGAVADRLDPRKRAPRP
jgi:predicted TIM-barrel enzyme